VLVESEIVVPFDQANGALLGGRELQIGRGRPTDVQRCAKTIEVAEGKAKGRSSGFINVEENCSSEIGPSKE